MEIIETIEILFLGIITQVYGAIGWPGVVFLMAIESAAIPFPSELIMPLAGWLLIQAKGGSVWWVLLAGFYGGMGNLLGSWVAYWISMKGGRPLLLKYGKYVLMSKDEVDKAEIWFNKYGEWAVFIGRLLPVVRTFISIPAGLARMNLWRFSLYTFAGSFIWSLGLAYGGFLLGENWEDLRAVMRPFDIPILLILAAGAIWLLVHRIKSIRAQNRTYDATDGTPGSLDE
ncbi:MAG TPA: DedA family protein [Dehalococcoidia bacterium]|jgi:membrane protein DedA with SNARE-associated domain|nr:MAG: alkaline phosphatase [SAR202 cluster bacterium]HIM79151.1 DedA family protein [Dehalococcoidia bacterium]